MHVIKAEIQGTSLVGLYILPLENITLIGEDVPESMEPELREVFGTDLLRVTIAGTSLLSVFAASDGKRILVPHIIFPDELAVLEEKGVQVDIIQTHQTCLGNNIMFTEKGCLVNEEYGVDEKEAIKNALGVPVKTFSIGDITAIGTFLAHNGTKGLIGYEADEGAMHTIREHLGLELQSGTVNLGSTQVHSGIAVNKNGFVIGRASGGPEVVHADEVFGFLEG